MSIILVMIGVVTTYGLITDYGRTSFGHSLILVTLPKEYKRTGNFKESNGIITKVRPELY